jgi:hypothetical protein
LTVERLETRLVPSTTARIVNGSLVIDDATAASHLAITALPPNSGKVANTFKVVDGPTTVGTFSNVTRDVVLHLTGGGDLVSINLNNLGTPGDVRAWLGDGSNALSLTNGTVSGSLDVHGGTGTDTVTLGGPSPLVVDGNVGVHLRGAPGDTLEVESGAAVLGSLVAADVNHVLLDSGSTVKQHVLLRGSDDGNSVTLAGAVGQEVILTEGHARSAGVFAVGGSVGGDVVFRGGKQSDTLHVTATIGGDLRASLGKGNDTVTVAGTVKGSLLIEGGLGNDTLGLQGIIGGDLRVHLGRGNDTVTVGGTVTGNLVLVGGPGNDTLTLSGTVGRHTTVRGGPGNDTVRVAAGAHLDGPATVDLGPGNDVFILDNAATISLLSANGGPGTNTFVGSRSRTGLTLHHFAP